MAAYSKDRANSLLADIRMKQQQLKRMVEHNNEPDASVYALSPRDAAMFPDASGLLVWDGIAYATNYNEAVKLTDGTVMTIDEFPEDVRHVITQGLDAMGF